MCSYLIDKKFALNRNLCLQIAHHVHSHSALRVFTYHKLGKKQMTPAELNAYDVVLTTYGRLALEIEVQCRAGLTIVQELLHQIMHPANQRELPLNLLPQRSHRLNLEHTGESRHVTDLSIKLTLKRLYSMKWRRVILDEGHQIRNINTNYAQAAAGIFAQSRWVLTGQYSNCVT